MGFFTRLTQADKIEAQLNAVVAKVDLGVAVLEKMYPKVEDMNRAIHTLNNKVGEIMSNQERANEIAAGIAEDTEVIARFADALLVAVANAQAEIGLLREQLAAEEADDVDLAGIEAATGKLSELADVFQAVLDPEVESPAPVDVPDVEPIDPAPVEEPVEAEPVEEPVEAEPVEEPVEEPAPDVEPGDGGSGDPTTDPVEEAPAGDDTVVSEPLPEGEENV